MTPVQKVSPPLAVWGSDALADSDYVDALESDTTVSRAPESWARLTLEGSPLLLRWFVVIGWRVVLGLRLGPLSSNEFILGWRIHDRRDDSIVLETTSWLLNARILMWTGDSVVGWSTMVRYRSPIARFVWPLIGILHRPITSSFLRHAVKAPVEPTT